MAVMKHTCIAEEVYYGIPLQFRHLLIDDVDTKENHQNYIKEQKGGTVSKMMDTWKRGIQDNTSLSGSYLPKVMTAEKGQTMIPKYKSQENSTELRDKILAIMCGITFGVSTLDASAASTLLYAGRHNMKAQTLKVNADGKLLMELLMIPQGGGEITRIYVTPKLTYASKDNPQFTLLPVTPAAFKAATVWEFSPTELKLLENPQFVWTRWLLSNSWRNIEL